MPSGLLVFLDSVQDDVDEAIGHLAIGGVGAEAEHLRHGGVVGRHAGDGGDDGAGIAFADGALTLSTREVLAQQLKDRELERAGVFEPCLVALQRSEQEHAVSTQVAAIALDDFFDDVADQSFVVVAIHVDLPLRDALGEFGRNCGGDRALRYIGPAWWGSGGR